MLPFERGWRPSTPIPNPDVRHVRHTFFKIGKCLRVWVEKTIPQALQNIIILQKYSVYLLEVRLHENVVFIVQISLKISVHRTTFLTALLRQNLWYMCLFVFSYGNWWKNARFDWETNSGVRVLLHVTCPTIICVWSWVVASDFPAGLFLLGGFWRLRPPCEKIKEPDESQMKARWKHQSGWGRGSGADTYSETTERRGWGSASRLLVRGRPRGLSWAEPPVFKPGL